MPRRREPRTKTRRRPAPPQAEQQRSRDTSESLLAAALHEFAKHGFDGASTRDIAAQAGVNQGLLTYHFASKEELWKAAVDRVFKQLWESFATRVQALEDVDAATRARALIRHFVRFAAAQPELSRLMLHEGKSDGPRLQWMVDQHVRPLYDFSGSLISDLQAQGLLPNIEHVHLHYMLIGAASLLFAMAPEAKRLSGQNPLQAKVIDAHADAITDLLFGGAPAAPAKTSRARKRKV